MEDAKKLSHAEVVTRWRVAFNRAAAVVCTLLGGAWWCAGTNAPPPPPPAVHTCARIKPLAPELRQEAHRVLQAPDRGKAEERVTAPRGAKAACWNLSPKRVPHLQTERQPCSWVRTASRPMIKSLEGA